MTKVPTTYESIPFPLDYERLDDVIEALTQQKEKILAQYPDADPELRVSAYVMYDSATAETTIEFERPLTQEELDQQKKWEEERVAHRRQQYEALKKEFGE